jgi:hypothetical protein
MLPALFGRLRLSPLALGATLLALIPFHALAASPDRSSQVRQFVDANARVSQFRNTLRWYEPLCLRVSGLTPEQNEAVKSRINAVAQTLAQRVYSPRHQSCPHNNVSIVFSTDPQHTLDRMIAHNPKFLGDDRSDTKGIKTVTRPVQAWRETVCTLMTCRPEPFPQPSIAATVLVDARRIGGASLGAVADYVAMLVLAEPKNLDHCQALPSVLDLFAGACQGHAAPTSLTRSDLAYLKALYTAGGPISRKDWNHAQRGGTVDQVAGRMDMLLEGKGSLIEPGAKPVLR